MAGRQARGRHHSRRMGRTHFSQLPRVLGMVTMNGDWARFTKVELVEAEQRLRQLRFCARFHEDQGHAGKRHHGADDGPQRLARHDAACQVAQPLKREDRSGQDQQDTQSDSQARVHGVDATPQARPSLARPSLAALTDGAQRRGM